MLCVSIMAKDNEDALRKMAKAAPYADLYELRLDAFKEFDLPLLVNAATKPLLITYRSKKEGGLGTAPYRIRLQYLTEAISLGVEYVDLEYSIPLEYRAPLLNNRGHSKIIMSKHLRNATPRPATLRQWLQKLVATGADIIKIVTKANEPSDNLRVLKLIPLAGQLGVPIIAFCMGEMGKISRLACIIMGGLMTFASVDENTVSAPGQISAAHMTRMLEILNAGY